jgi:phage terminase large subunit-like protein
VTTILNKNRALEGRVRQMSMAERISLLPEAERAAAIRDLAPTPEDLKQLDYMWEFWARPNQLPPEGEWTTWLITSGRGFGKTRVGSEFCNKHARFGNGAPIAIVGQTKADVRDTMVEMFESSIMKTSPPWFMPKLEVTKRRITWPNGVYGIMYSGDEPDQLRGPQHGVAWMDELAKFKYPQETFSNLSLGLRVGKRPQMIITTTPRPIPIIKQLLEDPNVVKTTGSTYENISNLPVSFIKTILGNYENTRLGAQEIYGNLLMDIDGALWNRDTLERGRVNKVPCGIVRVVVAVDPSTGGTTGKMNAETGIVVAALGEDGHGYVLEDASVATNDPKVWSYQAASSFSKFGADLIIAESNQGGQMVKSTLLTQDANLPVKLINASRGKHTRAEPVSNLYSNGKVHHVGMFADLEDQQCSWLPGENSPDRMDALVWAISELMIGGIGGMALDELAGLFEYV